MSMINKQVPDLSLPATGKQNINLKDLKGKKLILYFYPKDATPGCTQEGIDFNSLYQAIQKEGGELFGVSRDSVASHEKFKKNQAWDFQLISDENSALCKKFDVLKEKTMFGKTSVGVNRSSFVIDAQGLVRKEWRNVKVKGHAEEVFDFFKKI